MASAVSLWIFVINFFNILRNFSVSAAYRYRSYSYYSYYSYSYTGSTTSSIPVGAVGGIVAAGVLLVFLVFFTIICCQIHTRANRAIHPSSVNVHQDRGHRPSPLEYKTYGPPRPTKPAYPPPIPRY
ncbi:uncharacterized protein LOC111109837 [Crassostrea virginica]